MGNSIKKHLSRLAMPNTWNIKKKGIAWVTRPYPGAHPLKQGMSLNVLLRDLLEIADKTKEVKYILNNLNVQVDGKRRKDHRFLIGFMDVLSVPKVKKNFRILYNKRGKLIAIPIDDKESKIKICKIKGKTAIKGGKIQFNLYDGKNILAKKDVGNVGDSIIIELPSNKIKKTLEFDKGSIVYLTGGKHIGETGKLDEIKENKIICKKGKEKIETLKKYAFVIGKNKPMIKLPKENESNEKD